MIFILMCRVKIWKLASQTLRNDPLTLIDAKESGLKHKGTHGCWWPYKFKIIPLTLRNTVFNKLWLFLPTGQIWPGVFHILSFQIQMFSSVQLNRSVVSDSLWPHEMQHTRPPCPSPTPRVYSNSCPSSRWCHPATSSCLSPSPPALNLSQHQGLFEWVNSWHEVAKGLEFQLQHQSFQWTPRTDLL